MRGRHRLSSPSPVGGLAVALLFVTAAGVAVPNASGATPAPLCTFTASVSASPASGATPLLVQFNASVSSGTPTAYAWAFGDGTFWNASGAGSSTPFHRYAAPGTYAVSVTITEPGCGSTASTAVTVAPGLVEVLLSATPTSGPAPLHVRFNVSIAGGTGTYVTVNWTFGDGGAGLGVGLEYTYERPGTFSASVTVEDSGHHLGNATVSISASGPAVSANAWEPWVLPVIGGAIAFVVAVAVAQLRRRRGGRPARPPFPPSPTIDASGTSRSADPYATPEADTADSTAPRAAEPDLARLGSVNAPPPVAERRQLSRAVLLHVGGQGRLGPDEIAPPGLTQAGMAESLGVGQNSLTNVLRRFVAAGVLTQDLRHVRGRPRRLRVYSLTARGEALYQDIRRSRPLHVAPARESRSESAP